MKTIITVAVAVLALFLCAEPGAHAASVTVTYTSTTSSDRGYNLSFQVTNSMPASTQQSVYFWGVDLWSNGAGELDLHQDWSSSLGSPSNWGYWGYAFADWDSGAQHIYYIPWATDIFYTSSPAYIAPGHSLSGFIVHTNALPGSVHFFAYSIGQYYEAPDREALNITDPGPYELGFEGVAVQSSSVPVPASLLLFLPGFTGIALLRKRFTRGSV
jgi:hypothetical protein